MLTVADKKFLEENFVKKNEIEELFRMEHQHQLERDEKLYSRIVKIETSLKFAIKSQLFD